MTRNADQLNGKAEHQPPQAQSLHDLFERQAPKNPDAIALTAPGRTPLTYGRLYAHIHEVVETLNAMGVGRNDRIAIVLPNGPEMAVAFLSVAAGATSAPLNPAYRANEFDFYLSDLNAKALIIPAGSDSPAIAVAQAHDIPIIELSPVLEAEAGIFKLASRERSPAAHGRFAQPDDVALVLHTSGTTSRPKIVPLTQTNICTSACNIRTTLQLTTRDRCLNVMPLFHIHGLIGATLSSMVAGASIVCTPGFDASKFFDWLDEFQPTWYTAVPTVHQAVLGRVLDNQDRVTRSRLRLIRSSSSALPPQVMAELERVFNAPAIESYGMTEASHQMTSNPLPPGQRKPGSVGVPAGPEVAIMDEPGNRLSPGQVGEIVIRGANVMHGYENNPSANESSFTNGWFRTGDQGYFDTDGYLFIQGRIKEIINRGGEKIAPREVDEVLMDHPAVVQAVTFAVPHPTLGEDVATAVILQAGVTTTEKELRELAFARLADYKVPSQVVIVDEIPKGPTGKLQRIGLADKLASKLKAEYVAPRNSVEETLTQLWAETLDVERVGVYDNFFGLGGDSLLAARLFAQIEQHFGKKLPLATLFQTPTVEQLAGILTDEAWSAPWSSLVPIQPLGSRPPFFFVHAHGGNVVGYYDLARHLGPDQPFYGLQAQGLSEERVTPRRFEDMAAHYITEIRTVQPHGPYFLGGYCLGGDVAFEMAHQLRAQGEEVALLAMVQNPHPDYPRFRPGVTPLHILIYRALERIDLEISNFQEVKREAKWLHLLGRVKRLITLVQGGTETMIEALLARVHLQIPHSRTYILYALEKSHRMAYEDYQLRPYQGPVTLFRANKQPLGIYRDPTLGWDRLIEGQLECYEVPGHRIGMLSEPRVRILAEQLRACIDKAQRRYR